MKLYLDTAETDAWDDLMPTGLFYGITTNPLLAARAGLSYPKIDWHSLAGKARGHGAQELHAQLFGPVEGYVDWAGALYEAGRAEGIETVVKIPLIEAAIRKTAEIKSLGGRILMTACYDAKQMFVAQSLSAQYIAPYFGRMTEAGIDAKAHLSAMKDIQSSDEDGCQIMVASLRAPEQMVELAGLGMDVFTIAPGIAQALMSEARSHAAYAEFEAAARK
ncbi:MAG: transaldolase family protein [Paracoccaceae bacterium]